MTHKEMCNQRGRLGRHLAQPFAPQAGTAVRNLW